MERLCRVIGDCYGIAKVLKEDKKKMFDGLKSFTSYYVKKILIINNDFIFFLTFVSISFECFFVSP